MEKKIFCRHVMTAMFCFLVSSFSPACENGKVFSQNKNLWFTVPAGWTCAKGKNDSYTLSAPIRKSKLLNPYITFSQSKIKAAPDSPPPEDLWGEAVEKLIKKIDPKAKILYKKSVIVGGRPAFVSVSYVKYSKVHRKKKYSVRTFQKAYLVWSGKDKTMYRVILVTMDKDKSQFEPVLNKLIKSVKTQ